MTDDPRPAPARRLRFDRVISLSHVLSPGIPRWPGDPEVAVDVVTSHADGGYLLHRISLGEHSGTHVDAPRAFDPAGAPVDAIPPDSLVAPAVVVDVRQQAAADPDYVLTRMDLDAWEEAHGRVAPGALVLLWSGWAERWEDPAAFLGTDAAGVLHFPGFGAEAARWLVAERRIGGLGTDTHGVDPGPSRTWDAARVVLAASGLVIENLARLDQLPPVGATLVVGLLRIAGGGGSPATVLALV